MVNHCRTLLLNKRYSEDISVNYEYIDPLFIPVDLTGTVAEVHRLILADNPEQRVFECLKFMHATEYEQYIYELDPRITYKLQDGFYNSVATTSWVTTIRQISRVKQLNSGLFNVGLTEPFKTFYNLWLNHKLFTYRVSGLLFALCYKIEELR